MKTATLTRSKDLFAKILASEDIKIRRRSDCKVAAFDLRARVLHLPCWGIDDENITDMLLCHEVGHALHTPPQGWHNAIGHDMVMKSCLNIVEDARIERLIQKKFQGTISTFERAYLTLHVDRDMFKLKGLDVNTLSFADRFNIYFKIGHLVAVSFKNEEEREMVALGEKTKTWEDVVLLAKRMYDYCTSENFAPKPIEDGIPSDESSNGEGDEAGAKAESADGEGEEAQAKANGAASSQKEEGAEESNSDNAKGTGRRDESLELTGNTTDELPAEGDGNGVGGGNARGTTAASEYQKIGYSDDLHRAFEDEASSGANGMGVADSGRVSVSSYLKKTNEDYGHIPREMMSRYAFEQITGGKNKPIIDAMVREFEAKKAARREERKTVSKSGRLNPGRLARYKTTADVFKRFSVRGDVKNHGVVMIIDNSCSMGRAWQTVMRQAIQIGEFCSRVGIPCIARSFTDVVFDTRLPEWRSKISLKSDRLVGHTPLIRALFVSSEDIKQMYASGVDRVTVLALTDGEASDGYGFGYQANRFVVNEDTNREYVVKDASIRCAATIGLAFAMLRDLVGNKSLNTILVQLTTAIASAPSNARKIGSGQRVADNYCGIDRFVLARNSSLGFEEYSPTPTARAQSVRDVAKEFQSSMEDQRDARVLAREIAESIARGL